EALYNGDTSIRPVQAGETEACRYCGYGGICGFDPDARGAAAWSLPEMKMEEFSERLNEAEHPDGASPLELA
ncbi:MAG: hypothetical protein PHY64_10055, partial [Eubacteriales bacterium]|nr:hypothetical protein [Eubacteriales bacterium]